MPTKYVEIDNTPANKLFNEDTSRICFSIYNPDANAGNVAIIDNNAVDIGHYDLVTIIRPGETAFFSAIEGHNVTQPWFASYSLAATVEVAIYENFLDPSIMQLLEQKGINTTQGLPFLLLGLLAVSK